MLSCQSVHLLRWEYKPYGGPRTLGRVIAISRCWRAALQHPWAGFAYKGRRCGEGSVVPIVTVAIIWCMDTLHKTPFQNRPTAAAENGAVWLDVWLFDFIAAFFSYSSKLGCWLCDDTQLSRQRVTFASATISRVQLPQLERRWIENQMKPFK